MSVQLGSGRQIVCDIRQRDPTLEGHAGRADHLEPVPFGVSSPVVALSVPVRTVLRHKVSEVGKQRHWITSSARSSTDGGIVRPRAFAVFRLMTSSNLVGCSTGGSAGLAPLRILST